MVAVTPIKDPSNPQRVVPHPFLFPMVHRFKGGETHQHGLETLPGESDGEFGVVLPLLALNNGPHAPLGVPHLAPGQQAGPVVAMNPAAAPVRDRATGIPLSLTESPPLQHLQSTLVELR